jgi:hypothetical protein
MGWMAMKHRRRFLEPRRNPFAAETAQSRRAFLRKAAAVISAAAGAGATAGLLGEKKSAGNGYGDMPYGGFKAK